MVTRGRCLFLLVALSVSAATAWTLGCSKGGGGASPVGPDAGPSLAASAPDDFPTAATLAFGANLVSNGGAEANIGGNGVGTGPAPARWIRTGKLEVMKYGAAGGFPTPTSPGSPSRGRNFFSGGPVPPDASRIQQTIGLGWAAAAIDAGKARYELSGWLGGYGGDDDNARVQVVFLSATGATLGAKTIGPVLAVDRGSVTGFVRRAAAALVPKKARSARVTVTMTRVGGYNDGYADNISLILRQLP